MKPGIKRIIAGALLMIVGFVLIPVGMVLQTIRHAGSDSHKFLTSNITEVRVDEPGRYYLWNEYETVYMGANYSQSSSLPHGMVITVVDEQESTLALQSGASISINNMGNSKNSIAYVEVKRAGTYLIRVEGMDETRVFSWSSFEPMDMLMSFVVSLLLIVLLTLMGAGLVVWGIMRLCRKPRVEDAT